jgi:hypothetical protein
MATIPIRTPSTEETVTATFAALISSAGAVVHAADFAYLLVRGTRATVEDRLEWAQDAFRLVAERLPATSPYRAALETYVATEVEKARTGGAPEWPPRPPLKLVP